MDPPSDLHTPPNTTTQLAQSSAGWPERGGGGGPERGTGRAAAWARVRDRGEGRVGLVLITLLRLRNMAQTVSAICITAGCGLGLLGRRRIGTLEVLGESPKENPISCTFPPRGKVAAGLVFSEHQDRMDFKNWSEATSTTQQPGPMSGGPEPRRGKPRKGTCSLAGRSSPQIPITEIIASISRVCPDSWNLGWYR